MSILPFSYTKGRQLYTLFAPYFFCLIYAWHFSVTAHRDGPCSVRGYSHIYLLIACCWTWSRVYPLISKDWMRPSPVALHPTTGSHWMHSLDLCQRESNETGHCQSQATIRDQVTDGSKSSSGSAPSFMSKNHIRAEAKILSVQFSSVAQLCLILCDPIDCSTPGFPVHHQLPELTQTRVHWVSDAIQPSHPLSSPSPPAFHLSQHQSLFKWVSSSIQVAKGLEFQFQHQSFQQIFKTDFL